MRYVKKTKEFLEIFKRAKKIESDCFILYVSTNRKKMISSDINTAQELSIGVIVNSKIGNAVLRNKIKRRIKALLCELKDFRINKKVIIKAKEEIKTLDWYSLKLKLMEQLLSVLNN